MKRISLQIFGIVSFNTRVFYSRIRKDFAEVTSVTEMTPVQRIKRPVKGAPLHIGSVCGEATFGTKEHVILRVVHFRVLYFNTEVFYAGVYSKVSLTSYPSLPRRCHKPGNAITHSKKTARAEQKIA